MATLGVIFSIVFMMLQLIPIPDLSGVQLGKESYLMLIGWSTLDIIIYIRQRDKSLQ